MAVTGVVVQVAIFRSDALVTVLDLDRHLNVARADDTAGLLFGVGAKTLVRKPFARCGCGPISASQKIHSYWRLTGHLQVCLHGVQLIALLPSSLRTLV